jgi:hypothetical protein
MPLSKVEARKVMLAVQGTAEGPYFGKPSVFYAGSFVGRVHDKEDAVALRVGSIEMRDVMLEAEPDLFYITDHYKPWPMLLARLTLLNTKTLGELVAARTREIAAEPKKKSRKKAVKKQAAKTSAKAKKRK